MIGKILGRRPILSDRAQELRAREQELLERVGVALQRFGSDLQPEDLKQAATIVAAFVYNTAQRDEKLPRKELPKPAETRRGF